MQRWTNNPFVNLALQGDQWSEEPLWYKGKR